MVKIDKVPSEGEQSEAFTKIMKEMDSAFEFKKEAGKAHDLFVSPDIDQKKWQNFKIAAIKEFSDALDSPVSFFLNEPLVLIDTTVWGSGKKGIAVYVEFIVVMGVEAESRIYAFEDINSIAVIDEGREFVIEGGSKTNKGEDRNDEVKYVHSAYMGDTGINAFEKLLLYLNPSIKIEGSFDPKENQKEETAEGITEMALIDNVPSVEEQEKEWDEVLGEMQSAFDSSNDLHVFPKTYQNGIKEKWDNFKIVANKEFADSLDLLESFLKHRESGDHSAGGPMHGALKHSGIAPLVFLDETVWGSGKKGMVVDAECIVIIGLAEESRIYKFENINSIEVKDEGANIVIEGGSKTNKGEDRKDSVTYNHSGKMEDTGANAFEKLLNHLRLFSNINERREKQELELLEKYEKMLSEREKFYSENDLELLPNGNLRDKNFEEYELEEERGDFIVYKPEGMRGKRAYIKTDGENWLTWSGPIAVADKSKFLRGDLGTVEKESQPSEETAVQEKEARKNDATDDIVSRMEKLKELLDKGILTEEEYQKKKDELVSQI